MKNIITGLSVLLMIVVALFWEDVWAIFAGMSVIESLSMIVQFILHVTVATIAGYVVFGLPKIVSPWMRMFRRKQKQQRRQRGEVTPSPRGRLPKVNKDALLMALIEQEMQRQNSRRGSGR